MTDLNDNNDDSRVSLPSGGYLVRLELGDVWAVFHETAVIPDRAVLNDSIEVALDVVQLGLTEAYIVLAGLFDAG